MSENKEKVATINNQAEDNDGWIDAGEYSLKLEGDVIIARNAKGKVLKTVPAKAKSSNNMISLMVCEHFWPSMMNTAWTRFGDGSCPAFLSHSA